MKSFADLNRWQTHRDRLQGQSIGFVPTMGALHDGHLSLVKRAREENDAVVVSLRQLLENAGVDALLLPDADSLYPDGYAYRVCENSFSRQLCGAHRPGHFDGVLTVVMKLLNLVRPHKAYFGEKDYQQLRLIQGMVKAFFLPVEIIGCPIVREADGLAMSSRNQRLNRQQRQQAAALYRILSQAPDAASARSQLAETFDGVDYVQDLPGRRLAAVHLGSVRLIDNVPLPAQGAEATHETA